ncbi:HlyD family efflux transporter periplasmic adaptor subunit, partial [Candidatus Sumerlaeota bacterium]|nr:HlyD family efflux transporter periplasmic adaptor subunit [Candidatus Sumerlaeota bacterium]
MRNSKDTFTSPIKAGHRPAGRRGGITLKLGMTLALGVGAVLGFMKLRGSDDSSGGVKIPPNAKIKWVVKRGNLTISALAAGTLKTKNTTQIINELEKPTKIVWLIDEGTQVKQGDKLIELDAADLNEQLMKQKIRNAEVEQNEQKAKDDLAIADSKAKTDLIAAENKVTIAKLDLLKYKEGDFLQDKRKKESAVAIAQEELNRAKDKLEWTRKLAQKDYVTHNDLAADEFALTKCQIQLDTAREDLDLLNKFTYHRETSKLETALIEAEGDLERVRLTNQRELASKQAALEAATATAELERINTKNLEEQIAKAVLFAPRDGMVVYYKERYRESQQSMQIGTQLMPRQRLIDLPDFSAWMIEARVHESLIQKIKVGERAFVTIDAFADKVLEGTVSKISVLPDNSDWWRDAQEYIVQIDLTVKQPNFK